MTSRVFRSQKDKNALAGGAPPRTPLGEFTALPRPPGWTTERGGEGKKEGRGGEKGEGKGVVPIFKSYVCQCMALGLHQFRSTILVGDTTIAFLTLSLCPPQAGAVVGMPECGANGGRRGAQLITDKLAPAILVMQYHNILPLKYRRGELHLGATPGQTFEWEGAGPASPLRTAPDLRSIHSTQHRTGNHQHDMQSKTTQPATRRCATERQRKTPRLLDTLDKRKKRKHRQKQHLSVSAPDSVLPRSLSVGGIFHF